MERLQHDIAAAATFADDHGVDVDAVGSDEQRTLDAPASGGDAAPVVAGVDQAFLDDDRAVSAVVAMRGGEVLETATAVEPVEIPYIPGLLAFREGDPIVSALESLSVDPDCLLVDGSGRIHFREAGLATHIGVLFDLPAVGVAKSLLCGSPDGTTADLPVGRRVPIAADDAVTAPEGTTIGYAVQSRQFDSPNRSINPLYVSPGHRVGAETAAELVLAACAGYKLPEPIRRADSLAGEASD